jgi:hypothetical protein
MVGTGKFLRNHSYRVVYESIIFWKCTVYGADAFLYERVATNAFKENRHSIESGSKSYKAGA